MEIIVRIGEVKIEYRMETNEGASNAATCEEGFSRAASQKQLFKTIEKLAEEAKNLHAKLYL